MDKYFNLTAREGVDRCFCGCKYWEYDYCVNCATHIETVLNAEFFEYEGSDE